MDYSSLLTQVQQPNESLQQITNALAIAFWFSLIITVLFLAILIVGMIRKWKVQNAILDMHVMIREMNDRDKQRPSVNSQPIDLQKHSPVIAQTSPNETTSQN